MWRLIRNLWKGYPQPQFALNCYLENYTDGEGYTKTRFREKGTNLEVIFQPYDLRRTRYHEERLWAFLSDMREAAKTKEWAKGLFQRDGEDCVYLRGIQMGMKRNKAYYVGYSDELIYHVR